MRDASDRTDPRRRPRASRRSPSVLALGALLSLAGCHRAYVPALRTEPAGVPIARSDSSPAPPHVDTVHHDASWIEIVPAPAPGEYIRSKAVFTDRHGIWRCLGRRCVHFSPDGEHGAVRALDCDVSDMLAAAPDGSVMAQICGDDLVVIETHGTGWRSHALPHADVEALVVDSRGWVTLTARDSGNGWVILRYPPSASPPQRTVVTTTTDGGVVPATGKLLAYTNGNGPHEAAWFDGTPVEVKTNGLFMANGEHLWVSLASGRYVRQSAHESRPVRGAPKGGLPPCGILLDDTPWGPNGLMLVYEEAMLLLDAELESVGLVPLPGGTLSVEGMGEISVSTSVVTVASPDGNAFFVALLDGSVRRWQGSLQNPVEMCPR